MNKTDRSNASVPDVAEDWAQKHLGLAKARPGERGFDGTLPNGRKLQVKSKKAGAHSDGGTYVILSKKTLELADDLLMVFVDYKTREVVDTIGPVAITELEERGRQYYVTDIRASVRRAAQEEGK